MTGTGWSALGVFFSMIGLAIAGFGSYRSSRESDSKSDELIQSQKALIASQQEVISNQRDVKMKAEEMLAKDGQLIAKSAELIEKSEEISKLNREIAELSKQAAAYAMGTGSYFYLHIRNFGEGSQRTDLIHVGVNPVRDTEIIVFDITGQIPELVTGQSKEFGVDRSPRKSTKVDALYPGRTNRLVTAVVETNPTMDTYGYFVNLQGALGTIRQIIQLKKVGQLWKQAYIIQRVGLDSTFEPIGQFFDEGFPTDGSVFLKRRENHPNLPLPQDYAK